MQHRLTLLPVAAILAGLAVGCLADRGLISRPAQHEVFVRAEGSGSGHVGSIVGGINIDCVITAGAVDDNHCSDRFAENGGSRDLRLQAVPDSANRFERWTGCSEIKDGGVCSIQWRHDTPDTTFTVTVRFERD